MGSHSNLYECRWITRSRANGAVTVLELQGTLDWETFHTLEKHLDDLVRDGKVRLVMILRDLRHVTSVGIGCFITAQGHCRMQGGDVVFVDPGETITEVLDLLGLLPLMDIFETEDEAVDFLLSEDRSSSS